MRFSAGREVAIITWEPFAEDFRRKGSVEAVPGRTTATADLEHMIWQEPEDGRLGRSLRRVEFFRREFRGEYKMEIRGIHHLNGPQALQGPHRLQGTEAPQIADSIRGADQLELSSMDGVRGLGGTDAVLSPRVAQIRAEIAAGIYDTPARMEVAVGRLFDEIVG